MICLSDVKPERVSWLWPGRLPIGKLVVLDGDPSMGKSTLSLDLAARVSQGSPMPDGHPLTSPGSVLLLSAEDGAADTIRPRLDAAGANAENVHLLEGVPYPCADGETRVRPITLPGDVGRLRRAITDTRAVLVIVDVLNAFLSDRVDGHRDQAVRGALAPLGKMAEEQECCLLVLRHLNKAVGGTALYRGGGSIGIIGAARVGLLVGCDPDDEQRRVLAVSKSNLAKVAPSLSYRLVEAADHGCARVEWLGEARHTADALVAQTDLRPEPEADLLSVLRQILAAGPQPAAEVHAQCESLGFSRDQTNRAKRRLKITSTKLGRPGEAGGWVWQLPTPFAPCRGSGRHGECCVNDYARGNLPSGNVPATDCKEPHITGVYAHVVLRDCAGGATAWASAVYANRPGGSRLSGFDPPLVFVQQSRHNCRSTNIAQRADKVVCGLSAEHAPSSSNN